MKKNIFGSVIHPKKKVHLIINVLTLFVDIMVIQHTAHAKIMKELIELVQKPPFTALNVDTFFLVHGLKKMENTG